MEHGALPFGIQFDVIADKDGYGVATVHGGISQDGYKKPLKANAEFIVRACNSHYELVEAAKNLLKYAKDVQLPYNTNLDAWGAQVKYWEALEQAIAKATGKKGE